VDHLGSSESWNAMQGGESAVVEIPKKLGMPLPYCFYQYA
jgi:hypothetical protein